jgi:hypothetical protein
MYPSALILCLLSSRSITRPTPVPCRATLYRFHLYSALILDQVDAPASKGIIDEETKELATTPTRTPTLHILLPLAQHDDYLRTYHSTRDHQPPRTAIQHKRSRRSTHQIPSLLRQRTKVTRQQENLFDQQSNVQQSIHT